jgi:hypothetical protein
MYAALKYAPVTVISPLIAGYPLVTLLLSRAFLGKKNVGPQLIAGDRKVMRARVGSSIMIEGGRRTMKKRTFACISRHPQ